ncbi:MAG TPA: hypothetical protein VFR24_18020 [Candidatus Angelobacter sp.]|nr:hypothetical protein [Candidatus Angelobacter sp.]
MKPVLSVFVLLLFVLCLSLSGLAQSAGYDLLQTGSGASIDLTSAGLGVVPLSGLPIQGSTGNTDTIMHRTSSVPSGGGTVPVNVTALFMKSTNSVTYQGQSTDVYVTINNSGGSISTSVLPQPDSLSGSTGNLTVRTDGTFDSSISVNADVIFVKAGQSVTSSSNWIGHQAASGISLSSTNSTWSSTAPSGYPSSSTYPSGGFYPKPVHTGPHPVVPAKCGGGTAPSTLNPAGTGKSAPNNAFAVACIAVTTTQ